MRCKLKKLRSGLYEVYSLTACSYHGFIRRVGSKGYLWQADGGPKGTSSHKTLKAAKAHLCRS